MRRYSRAVQEQRRAVELALWQGMTQHEDHISGVEAFARQTSVLRTLLADLAPPDWTLPTVRDLDVQELIGHLIGVELAFAMTLGGDESASDADHVASTQPAAEAQRGREPVESLHDWAAAVRVTLGAVIGHDPAQPLRFHGIGLTLDALMVARAFEIWTHADDIRCAVGLAPADPDPETLTRMTDFATMLLPIGLLQSGQVIDDAHARLVLTGPGGGTWDVPLDGDQVRRAKAGARFDTHVVVDAAEFCRVIANRADLLRSGAIVRDDPRAAGALFAGAATLALD